MDRYHAQRESDWTFWLREALRLRLVPQEDRRVRDCRRRRVAHCAAMVRFHRARPAALFPATD
jgi:hypothetical protein